MNWYYLEGETVSGPISDETLWRKIESKQLHGESLVCQEGEERWVEVNSLTIEGERSGGQRDSERQASPETKRKPKLKWILVGSLIILVILLAGVLFASMNLRENEADSENYAETSPEDSANSGWGATSVFLEGYRHYSGENRPVNYEKAVERFENASNEGEFFAQYWLGQCYLEGHGVEHDVEKFALWTLRSAEVGFGPAQLSAGAVYAYGMGRDPDIVTAYMWANLAATSNYEEVKVEAQALREKLERQMWANPEQLREAQRLSSDWQEKPPWKKTE